MSNRLRVLIVGYGNPLRGDDGFGWRAAERLKELIDDRGIGVLTLHQLTPELMELLSRAGFAVFLDARQGANPGEILERPLDPRPAPAGAFTHHLTPEGLLGGALALYGHAPQAVLITVTGRNFELSERLSPEVAGSLEPAVAAALRYATTR